MAALSRLKKEFSGGSGYLSRLKRKFKILWIQVSDSILVSSKLANVEILVPSCHLDLCLDDGSDLSRLKKKNSFPHKLTSMLDIVNRAGYRLDLCSKGGSDYPG